MTITLDELAGASNGPRGRPSMLSVGDSLMWGQGLRPEHRFREIVRVRLGLEVDVPVVELSMARSGARVHPQGDPGMDAADTAIHNTLVSPPVQDHYSPDWFAREVLWGVPTTLQQLVSAEKILTDDDVDPEEIRWILLNGGINDVGIGGILAPIRAIQDGYVLSTWNAWLRDQSRIIEDEMSLTLRQAMELFPKAVVVVTGYFPVFSYYSIGNIFRLQSVGLLHGIANLVLTSPFGLDALATASSTWQAVSNKHLRRAVKTVRREYPGRTILFARSYIEGSHCLFAPGSWLWGYDAVPDDVPDSTDHWLQWLAGATPEDEVIDERIARCQELVSDPKSAIVCRLASIGHPNVAGAVDYARSIIETMEDAGVISSDLHPCSVGRRRRQKGCARFSDEWAYTCVSVDAAIGEACEGAVTTLAEATASQFSQAADHVGQAGDHLGQAVDCYDGMADDLQACDNTEAAEIAQCNAAHGQRVNGPCNIRCTRFTNCNRFRSWDPRRYACRIARGVCVAAAATARAVCRAGSRLIRETCRGAAWARSTACKTGVVGGDTLCAAGEVSRALVDVAIAAGHAAVGVGLAGATAATFVGCKVGGWMINRTCRLTNWAAGQLCKIVATFIDGLCWVGTVVTWMPRRVTGSFRAKDG